MFKKLYKSMTVIFDIVFFRCFMVIVLAEVFYLQVVNEDFDDYARDITRPGFINNGAKGLSPESAWRFSCWSGFHRFNQLEKFTSV